MANNGRDVRHDYRRRGRRRAFGRRLRRAGRAQDAAHRKRELRRARQRDAARYATTRARSATAGSGSWRSSGPTRSPSPPIEFKRTTVTGIKQLDNGNFLVQTKRRGDFETRCVLLDLGTKPRVLGIPGEQEFAGHGVAYCATCDAEMFKGKEIYVLGAGDQAIEEADYLTGFASKVTVIVLHEEGHLDCNEVAAATAFRNPKIDFVWNSTLAGDQGTRRGGGARHQERGDGHVERGGDGRHLLLRGHDTADRADSRPGGMRRQGLHRGQREEGDQRARHLRRGRLHADLPAPGGHRGCRRRHRRQPASERYVKEKKQIDPC